MIDWFETADIAHLQQSIYTRLKTSPDKMSAMFGRKMDRGGSGYIAISELLDDLLAATNDDQRHTSSTNEAEEHRQPSDPNASGGQDSAAGTKRNVEQGAVGSLTDVKKTRTQQAGDPGGMEG